MTELVRETLAALVRTPSINPELAPDASGAGEAAIADVITGWLTERRIEAWQEEAAPGRPNVVARVGTGGGRTLVLCAHMDTVGVEDMSAPFEPRVADGRLYGRGSYDMKSGAAAIMSALVELSTKPPAGSVLAAFVVDEEYASIGASDFVRRHRADACILTEPSEEQLVLAHKGFVWLEVETSGTAAHGSRWDLGTSALPPMAQVVTALDAFDRTVLRQRTHPLVGPASLHCGRIEGGEGWSTYAAKCTLHVERRTLPGESADDVVAELRGVIHDACPDASIRTVLQRSPLECEADAPIARALGEAAREVLGREPDRCGVAYWMDAAIFADAGIPAVDFGVIGGGAHAAEEWVELASVERVSAVLASAARTFLAAT